MAKKNPWLDFLKSYRRSHPKLNMKSAMKAAAVEWRKHKSKAGKKKK